MENNNEKIEAAIVSNPYRLAIHQGVHIKPMTLGKNTCGIYQEIAPDVYQIFLNEQYTDKPSIGDDTMNMLMSHHNSSKKGETKVITIDDLNFFTKIREEVKKYEQKLVDAFLKKGLSLSSIFKPQH